jgi:hypothetical protein
MEEYKICPVCGTANSTELAECTVCRTDIGMVMPILLDIEDNIALCDDGECVKVCACGEINEPEAGVCPYCGSNISAIEPVKAELIPQESISFTLTSTDGSFVYEVGHKETVIGRDAEMSNILASKSYVSRVHAKLFTKNEDLFIENLSNTNFTHVNNQRIIGPTRLCDGDEIGLGGININGRYQREAAYFTVHKTIRVTFKKEPILS